MKKKQDKQEKRNGNDNNDATLVRETFWVGITLKSGDNARLQQKVMEAILAVGMEPGEHEVSPFYQKRTADDLLLVPKREVIND